MLEGSTELIAELDSDPSAFILKLTSTGERLEGPLVKIVSENF